jgi:hypothetical protein
LVACLFNTICMEYINEWIWNTHKKREKNKIKTIEPFQRGRCVIQAGRLCEISIYAPFCSFIVAYRSTSSQKIAS